MKLRVIVEPDKDVGGYIAYLEDNPGVIVEADDLKEIPKLIKIAYEDHLDYLQAVGVSEDDIEAYQKI